ncbi:MAG: bacteriohopanetetrol glucosamine biosynthesis glycosyltransferase HpnI [Bryobacteraceae bacterium]
MIWLAVPAIASAAYWLLVIVAARFRAVQLTGESACPTPSRKAVPAGGAGAFACQPLSSRLFSERGVSILKPVHGRDPHFYEAIRSHAVQDYPQYEILFGIGDPEDPAAQDIRRLIAEFPERSIRLIAAHTKLPNGKVGVLVDLAAEARYPLLLVNDSDIRVPRDYLRQVTATLEQPQTGLVTCLYRAQSDRWPGRWEALGVATEFVPSVLVARMLGSGEFALGSTLLLRAEDLRRIGGFAAIGDYLADDYQLGRRIRDLGLRIAFAPTVVETHLAGDSWRQVWRHQLRWSRTIRISRPGGYCGYLVTHATFWSLVAFAAGAWPAGVAALLIRVAAGIWVGRGVLHDSSVARYACLIPFRDLWGFAIWLCGLFGTTVEWRGIRLKITSDGKIITDL